jgi:hypothetical protein
MARIMLSSTAAKPPWKPGRTTALVAVRRGPGAGQRRQAQQPRRPKTWSEVGQGAAHSFIGAVIGSGAVSPADLAHTLSARWRCRCSTCRGDLERCPRTWSTPSWPPVPDLVLLGKRGNRLFIGGADPTDQEAVERIKFATQLSPEWVIVEYDKLAAARTQGSSAGDAGER